MADQNRSTVSLTNAEASLLVTLLESKVTDQRSEAFVQVLAEKILIKVRKRLGLVVPRASKRGKKK